MIYTNYLVCYDIPSNKLRKSFSDTLLDLGLIRLQESVFYGGLKRPEIMALEKYVRETLKEETDKCLWFPCHFSHEAMKSFVGYSNFEYIEPDGHGFW